MKIKKVVINNFRNYYEEHEFYLDRDIVILFGENGFGKSSFFDAIEWCITNEIERFKPKDGDLSFTNYDCINHLAREDGRASCCVSIYYEEYKLHRIYSAQTNRTEVYLYKIADKIENLIVQGQERVTTHLLKWNKGEQRISDKLIKHSYILSQDQITDFIRNSPKDRFDALASIMGIKNIVQFIDNLNTSYKALESLYDETQKEISNKQKLIDDKLDSHQEYKQLTSSIDRMSRELANTTVHFPADNKEIDLAKLELLIQQNTQNLLTMKEKLTLLDNASLEYTDYNQLQNRNVSAGKEIERLLGLTARVKTTLTSTESDLASLSDSLQDINKIKRLSKTIENKRAEIEEIQLSITNSAYSAFPISELNLYLSKYQKELSIVEYTLSHSSDFQQAQKQLSELPLKIEATGKISKLLQIRIEKLTNINKALKNWLINNDVTTSLQGLVHYLEGIYEYVKGNETKGFCPTCSSYVGEELEQRIANGILSQKSRISTQELNVVRVLEQQTRRDEQLANVHQEHRFNNQELKELISMLSRSDNLVKKITGHEYFNKELFELEAKELLKIKNQLLGQIKHITSIKDLKQRAQELETEYHSFIESANIRKIDDNVESTFKKQENLLQRKRERLEKLNRNIYDTLEDMKVIHNNTLLTVNKLAAFDNIPTEQRGFRELATETKEKVLNLQYNQDLLSQFKEMIVRKHEKEKGLAKLVHYQQEKYALDQKLGDILDKKIKLSTYIKRLNSYIGEHAIGFLNQHNSKIQQYYRYLNPLPAINGNLQFVIDRSKENKTGLSISIPFKNSSGEEDLLNARYTLSSAQLNTLAIAIFLVINDSQDIGIFDFVAIDDPIQNMDDVNRYTMCDILGELDKQLLFSTHDLEFLKLFIKKNEHKKQNIKVYFLETPNLVEGKIREVKF